MFVTLGIRITKLLILQPIITFDIENLYIFYSLFTRNNNIMFCITCAKKKLICRAIIMLLF